MSATRRGAEPQRVGWREWVALPRLAIDRIKAKIDTGARTSALHASGIRFVSRGRLRFVRFTVHPIQRDSRTTVAAEALLVDLRRVKSSTGHVTERPVILTEVDLLGTRRAIQLTLVPRDTMGFRMLLGRQALRGAFLVDAGRSYLGGRPPRLRRKKISKKEPRP